MLTTRFIIVASSVIMVLFAVAIIVINVYKPEKVFAADVIVPIPLTEVYQVRIP